MVFRRITSAPQNLFEVQTYRHWPEILGAKAWGDDGSVGFGFRNDSGR